MTARARRAGAGASCMLERQSQRLARLSAKHALADRVASSRRAARRGRRRRGPPATTPCSRILMLTSWSEQSTPRRVVDRVRVDAPAVERVLDAAALGEPEVAALADDAAAQLVAVDADARRSAVAGLGVRLLECLHVGADAAVPQQVDRRAEDRLDQLARGSATRASMPSARRASRRQRDRLRGAREDAAARGDERRGRSRPRTSAGSSNSRSRSAKHAAGSGSGSRKTWRWSNAATSRMCSRQQHPVAEHVAGHVADADDGERPRCRRRRPARGSGAARTPTRRAR